MKKEVNFKQQAEQNNENFFEWQEKIVKNNHKHLDKVVKDKQEIGNLSNETGKKFSGLENHEEKEKSKYLEATCEKSETAKTSFDLEFEFNEDGFNQDFDM